MYKYVKSVNTSKKSIYGGLYMNKVILVMICIIVIIGAMFTAIMIFKPNKNETVQNVTTTKVSEEEILDDCTDEYEQMQENQILEETSSNEEKISPNCSFTIKTYYKKCGHTISEYSNLPEGLVNLNKEQLQEKYPNYEIEKFASNEIILYQEKEEECNEHYIVKDKEGNVVIYKILEDGTNEEYEVTRIATEYLTDTDKINLKNGIRVNGEQELNQLIEDFE